MVDHFDGNMVYCRSVSISVDRLLLARGSDFFESLRAALTIRASSSIQVMVDQVD
jgi:hypothetical protein